MLQPDITIVCDKSKIDKKGCFGVPDIVVEVLSPSTASRDMKTKFEIYEYLGVKEYWIADSENNILMIFTLGANGEYSKPKVYSREDSAKSVLFDDFEINLSEVFEEVD